MEGSGGGAVRDRVQCAEGVHTVHEGGVLTCRERAAGEVYGSVRCASGACIHYSLSLVRRSGT